MGLLSESPSVGLLKQENYRRMAQNNPAQYYRQSGMGVAAAEGLLGTWLGQAYDQDIKPAWDAYEPQWSDLYNAPIALATAVGESIGSDMDKLSGSYPLAMAGDENAMQDAAEASLNLGLETMGGGSVVSRMSGVPRGAVGANVWQGGPHKYGPEGARESLQHINKGEGAQAYGWGRYDAENPKVGQQYKDQMARMEDTYKANNPNNVTDWWGQAEEFFPDDGGKQAAWHILNQMKPDAAMKWFDEIKYGLDDAGKFQYAPGKMLSKDDIKEVSNMLWNEGYLYKHDLPDEDIARYLDWDAPLSEQPESVRAALGYGDGEVKAIDGGFSDGLNAVKISMSQDPVAAGKFQLDGVGPLADNFKLDRIAAGEDQAERVAREWLQGASKTGAQAYEGLANLYSKTGAATDPKMMASKEMGAQGIPGLKYYDGMNRGQPFTVQTYYKGKPYSDPIPAHGSQVDDLVKKYEDKGYDVKVTEGTRNYVTWDQGVLDRMSLLERNGIDAGLLGD